VNARAARRLAALAALAVAALGAAPTPSPSLLLPALVFVSRGIPAGADAGLVPGLGPMGRTLATGGRLLIRERDGRVHALLPPHALFDVSDPCVSWDGLHIAFAGTPAPDSAWRVCVVGRDGSGLHTLTHPPEGADDFDPVWLADGRVCFASTRFAHHAQPAAVAVTNLYVVSVEGGEPERITAERSGAEEPAVDPASGRIVYARWWTNRFRASNFAQGGVTSDAALAISSEEVDLWQAVSVQPDGSGIRLAAGDARDRDATMAYQPAIDAVHGVVAVRAADRTLVRARGRYGIQRLARLTPPYEPGGAALAGYGRDPSSACAPAWLPGGRLVFARDLGGRGDFGLWVLSVDMAGRAGAPRRVLDLRGTAELDAAPIVRRIAPRIHGTGLPLTTKRGPTEALQQIREDVHTFRFDCLNVFANAPIDAPIRDAPQLATGVRIRFFTALEPEVGAGSRADTMALVREVPVDRTGAVHEHDLPGDVPMFEQLVDSTGRVLMSAHDPAHVSGFNFARAGSGTQCVGCHAGHSAMEVPLNNALAQWFNASTSAVAFVSAARPGNAGAGALIDRRSRGVPDRVAWIAPADGGPVARLAWSSPIEVRALVFYDLDPQSAAASDAGDDGCEVVFSLAGREIRRLTEPRPNAGPARLEVGGVIADMLEIRPRPATHRRNVAIAEIETIARIP